MRFVLSGTAALLAPLVLLSGCDGNQLVDSSEFGTEQVATVRGEQLVVAPSGLAAVPVSETRIDLTWVDNASNESGFELYRSTNGQAGTFELRARPLTNATAYTEAFAEPGTQYCFKIRAVRSTGVKSTYSEFSNTVCATTPEPPPPPPTPPPPPPAAVEGLDVAPYTSTAAWMFWGLGPNQDGFRIERSLDGGTSWSSVGTVSSPVFYNEGLTSEQQVCYRVIAYNLGGDAPSSHTDCTAPPAAPTNLVATPRDDGGADLRWSDNSAVEDGYEVWSQIIDPYVDCELGCYTQIYEWSIGTLPANSTSYSCWVGDADNYGCGGRPTFVRAKKDGGESDNSNIVQAP
jgi:hypothetical protein